jgi:tartrate-resistant acid phosphatase type 5
MEPSSEWASIQSMVSSASVTLAGWSGGSPNRTATARWKIVYGHHPIYSYGDHGDTAQLKQLLLPVLRGRAQIYIAGHEHLVQDLQPEGGVHFLVAPSAGQKNRPVQSGPKTLAVDTFEGFTVFDIDAQHLKVAFVDCEGKIRYQTEIP